MKTKILINDEVNEFSKTGLTVLFEDLCISIISLYLLMLHTISCINIGAYVFCQNTLELDLQVCFTWTLPTSSQEQCSLVVLKTSVWIPLFLFPSVHSATHWDNSVRNSKEVPQEQEFKTRTKDTITCSFPSSFQSFWHYSYLQKYFVHLVQDIFSNIFMKIHVESISMLFLSFVIVQSSSHQMWMTNQRIEHLRELFISK